ncbi:MAG: hypothetical protein Q9174_000400 [Haloplaca sp. 1 TL-2023]
MVESIAVTDYSTGTQYSYSGTSGTWQSIESEGGKVGSGGGEAVAPVEADSSSSTSSGAAPLPFSGTHKDTAVTTRALDEYPWVATTLATSTTAPTSYPNLPSGYKTSQQASSTSSPPGALVASPADGGFETVTAYDQRGFPTTIVKAKGAAVQYDNQGFLITPSAALAARASPTAATGMDTTVAAPAKKKVTQTSTSAAVSGHISTQLYLVASCGFAVLAGTLAL